MTDLPCAAILFDMDGVLVDSTAVVRRTWRRWCERTGIDEAAVLDAAHGRRTMDTLRAVAPDVDLSVEARWLGKAELDDSDGIVAIPGARELLRSVPSHRWAVVTSASRELARRRLEWADLPSPHCLVPAEAVRRGKPSPEGYLRAAAELEVADADCLVLEDSPAGVEAAHAAGMRVVGVATSHDADDLIGVEVLVPDLAGIELRQRSEGMVMRLEG